MTIDLLACFLSSYYYAYLAAFDNEEFHKSPDDGIKTPVLVFEIIFAVSILLKFNLEYEVDEQPLPFRDYGKIADRYLKN